MNAKNLGIELAKEIQSAVFESGADVCSGLEVPLEKVFLEYIALLLWTAAKEIQNSIPKQHIQAAIDSTFSATFFLLEEAGIKKLITNFTHESFQSFMHDRFETYYSAWRAFPISNDELSETILAHNFVLFCVTDNEDLSQAKHPDQSKYARHIKVALRYYRIFTGRAKALVSRY